MGTQIKEAASAAPVSLEDRIAQLEAENAQLVEAQSRSLSVNISAKGCLMLTGVRSFPLSFYDGEWDQIHSDKAMSLIAKGREVGRELGVLSTKDKPLQEMDKDALDAARAKFRAAMAAK